MNVQKRVQIETGGKKDTQKERERQSKGVGEGRGRTRTGPRRDNKRLCAEMRDGGCKQGGPGNIKRRRERHWQTEERRTTGGGTRECK